MSKQIKLVILDRDGVINKESPDYIKSPDEWYALPGSLEAIAMLTKAGFTVAVATNQSGVGRGLYTEDTLSAIHDKMLTIVTNAGGKIDSIFYCPHKPDDACDCRKPKPALLLRALNQLGFLAENTVYIGDSWRDMEAAIAANCKGILVKTGNGQRVLQGNHDLKSIDVREDLRDAVNHIIARA